jgi:endonuclease YncB( thermonuclease family)
LKLSAIEDVMSQSSSTDYKDLFQSVCQIYEATLLHAEETYGTNKNSAYFQMGRQIGHILESAEQTGHYGKKLVPTLCRDLKQKYGRGPSSRTMRNMRKFATLYTEDTVDPALSWSHYCVLLSIRDADTRARLEQQAIRQHLDRDALQQLVSLTLQLDNEGGATFPLSPRSGSLQIAKLIRPDASTPPLIDVGFGVQYAPNSARLHRLEHGTCLQRCANGQLKPIDCAPGERYCYSASLENVIDGDTVKLRIQLTGSIFICERFRLRGVDAMELNTSEGQKAKRALERLLHNKENIIIYTYSTDRYGRYVADLVADDLYINKALVEKGHARYLSMRAD